MIKVDVELGIVAIVGMRMRFVEARFVKGDGDSSRFLSQGINA
jgi:hypothetical protein